MLLKLLNHNLDKCLVTLDFSRRTCPSSLAASVCELQHLVFHQVCTRFTCVTGTHVQILTLHSLRQIKASLHNAVIEWTTCSQVLGLLALLVHKFEY